MLFSLLIVIFSQQKLCHETLKQSHDLISYTCALSSNSAMVKESAEVSHPQLYLFENSADPPLDAHLLWHV